ncbi:MAG TPA: IS3 family transposase [Actinomycetota bacterium]
MPVRRFCRRLGIPHSTWYYWRQATRGGRGVRRWPSPVVDAIEEPAAERAHRWSAWGHRKVHAMLTADGYHVSPSSVERALRRRGLLLPARYLAQRRENARRRRACFLEPPTRRNRVWQMDFTQFETTSAGTWYICGVVDYATKLCLGAPVSGTQTARDATEALRAAVEAVEARLGRTLLKDCVDRETGELRPVVVVTDNGPAYKSSTFLRFIMSRPELEHVRTRHHAPETNGVVERFFRTLKYDHLYRLEIPNAAELAEEVDRYLAVYNEIRPHETLGQVPPTSVYLTDPNLFQAGSVQET